jgi:hypothetical protein
VGELTSIQGIVALAAAGVGLVALILAIVLAVKVRRLRSAQVQVLGDAGDLDLVEHAARLEQGFVALRDWVDETATGIESRMVAAESRIGPWSGTTPTARCRGANRAPSRCLTHTAPGWCCPRSCIARMRAST